MKNIILFVTAVLSLCSLLNAQTSINNQQFQDLKILKDDGAKNRYSLIKSMAVAGDRLYLMKNRGPILLLDRNLNYMDRIVKDYRDNIDILEGLHADESGRLLLGMQNHWLLIDGQERRIPMRSNTTRTLLYKGSLYVPLAYQLLQEGEPFLRKISLWGVQEGIKGRVTPELLSPNGVFVCVDLKGYKGKIFILPHNGSCLLEYDNETETQKLIKLNLPSQFLDDPDRKSGAYQPQFAIGRDKVYLTYLYSKEECTKLLSFDLKGKYLSTASLKLAAYRACYLEGSTTDRLLILSSKDWKVYYMDIEN